MSGPMPGATFRILHVEDDRDVQLLVRLSLRCLPGVMVRSVARGDEALQAARELRPDLVLLDVRLPGLDGLEILRSLREEVAGDLPVVLMTSKASPDDLEGYRRLGVDTVIPKPFDPRSLPLLVNQLLGLRVETAG